MKFQLKHHTRYSYSQPVQLAPHLLRLQPRNDGAQRLADFELDIFPAPAGCSSFLDIHGNNVTQAWFEKPTIELNVTAVATVETSRSNPFDFLLTPANESVPPDYYGSLRSLFHAAKERPPNTNDEIDVFAKRIATAVDQQSVQFLSELCREIFQNWQHEKRPHGAARPPVETFHKRSGACRDLACLYIDACRAVGFAARFVSGYSQGNPQDRNELHAWAEVYMPGAGWRGFDPTTGLATADRHITIAAATLPGEAAAVSGGYVGSAESSLEFDVEVQSATATTTKAQKQTQKQTQTQLHS